MHSPETFTAFLGHRRLAAGPLADVAVAAKRALALGATEPLLTYADADGRLTDLDLRGTEAEIAARHSAPPPGASEGARGRGRPKLGVVAREVTLLPRHWDWLSAQPGGASTALRKLVETARKSGGADEIRRRRTEAAYTFMSSIAGDFPGFEEASRALFASDAERFRSQTEDWPSDVREHAFALAFAGEARDA